MERRGRFSVSEQESLGLGERRGGTVSLRHRTACWCHELKSGATGKGSAGEHAELCLQGDGVWDFQVALPRRQLETWMRAQDSELKIQ